MMNDLKYPVGVFELPELITPELLQTWIKTIEDFPSLVEAEITKLTEAEQQLTYRPGGWTVKQVVNHCLDSHMNSAIRFKLALTEDNPTIKPYLENKWAELTDTLDYPLSMTQDLLSSVHKRWVFLLKSLDELQLARTYTHPETKRVFRLDEAIALYSWHCDHHLAHIRLVTQKL